MHLRLNFYMHCDEKWMVAKNGHVGLHWHLKNIWQTLPHYSDDKKVCGDKGLNSERISSITKMFGRYTQLLIHNWTSGIQSRWTVDRQLSR